VSWTQRIAWLSGASLAAHLGLGMLWVAVLVVFISHITAGNPELQQVYLKLQKEASSSLDPGVAAADRFFDQMNPILVHVPWLPLAILVSLCGFAALGAIYSRLSGETVGIGVLPTITILSGQNPITLALGAANHGIQQAQFPWYAAGALLILQFASLYAGASLGQIWYQRSIRR